MICRKCGSEAGDGKFCLNCGAAITTSQTANIATPTNNNISSNQIQQQLDIQREQLRIQQAQLNLQVQNEAKKKICPRCRSNNVTVQAVAEQKKRGCLMSIVWIVLACCTLGLIILIPLLTRKGSKTKTYAICQSCGHRWKV